MIYPPKRGITALTGLSLFILLQYAIKRLYKIYKKSRTLAALKRTSFSFYREKSSLTKFNLRIHSFDCTQRIPEFTCAFFEGFGNVNALNSLTQIFKSSKESSFYYHPSRAYSQIFKEAEVHFERSFITPIKNHATKKNLFKPTPLPPLLFQNLNYTPQPPETLSLTTDNSTNFSFLHKSPNGDSGAIGVIFGLIEKTLYFSYLGDVEIVLINPSKQSIFSLYDSHSVYNPEERNRVKEQGGFVNQSRSCGDVESVSESRGNVFMKINGSLDFGRALGGFNYKQFLKCEPDEGEVRLSAGARFLVIANKCILRRINKREMYLKAAELGEGEGRAKELARWAVMRTRSLEDRKRLGVLVVDLERFLKGAG